MKALLIKDFKMLRRSQRLIVLMLLLGLLVFIFSGFINPSPLIGVMSFVGAVIAVNTISMDGYNSGNQFLFTLPISRKTYALEKYIFCILTAFVFFCIAFLIAFCFELANRSLSTEFLLTSLWIFDCDLLFLTIVVPVELHFGPEKSRVAIIITIFALFLILTGLSKIFKLTGTDVINILSGYSEWTISVVLILISLVSLYISYRISVLILEKKEF